MSPTDTVIPAKGDTPTRYKRRLCLLSRMAPALADVTVTL